MSYGVSAALQVAIFQALTSDAALGTLVGANIFDAVPSGTAPSLYVTLGPELARDRSDGTGAGAEHRFTVSVVTDSAGFATAKQAAAAVSDALVDADLSLSRGTLVSLTFFRARAVRVAKGNERRIDLTFRARVQDD
ncbi:DUF3168 domain-containing protein [Thalassorhabdomicrobium marinisediminis]|uniref:DUF3168 domain-containing protein n=1 Tax=Thalassorhabdomicrobium marinisediminis TaxID=2170577 RepID=A0A2T7G0Z5_9RHOB|nr:DUF3168 domain-containing protein [Thalassorhabdomicrobium marinisediminis]PVA08058.1 DUF3168 domain-containing protein [Thalassorhabdomicrobium marinisediminis]